MTDPSDEELDRAERVRKLRSGGARSRSHEVREQRRERAEGDAEDAPPRDDEGDCVREDDPRSDDERADVLSLAADLPDDGSLFVMPVREELRRQFDEVAEQLHRRYGGRFDDDLDPERHVRPLALYLGVKTLEGADVEVVKRVLETTSELPAPGERDDGGE